jgi:hypothetical protein
MIRQFFVKHAKATFRGILIIKSCRNKSNLT